MRSITCTCAMLLLAGVTMVWARDRSTSVGGMSVDFVGNSGELKIYPTADNTNFIQLKQSKLQEVDATGNVVSSRSVNLQSSISDAAWLAPSTVTLPSGVVFLSTSFLSTISLNNQNVQFSLMAQVYQNDSSITVGGQSLAISRNSLKFSINVTNWPFLDYASHTLNYAIEITSKGGNSGASLENKHGSNRDKAVVFVNGVMDLPTVATVNGESVTVGVSVVTDNGGPGNGNRQLVSFSFPPFNGTLYYDPTVCIGCTNAGSAGTFAPSALLIAAAVLLATLGKTRAV